MTDAAHTPEQGPLRLATRGSQLARWQTSFVAERLARTLRRDCEAHVIRTEGDRVQDRFLHEIGGKGLFVRELEEAVRRGEADAAVHSLKDMPARQPEDLAIVAVLARHSVRDVCILRPEVAERLALEPGTLLTRAQVARWPHLRIGTASLRRQALLRGTGAPLQLAGLRGNVDTRLRKLTSGVWDAIVLAEAALDRLQLEAWCCPLDPDWFTPSPGQGAIAVEAAPRSSGSGAVDWGALGCAATEADVHLERSVLAALGGDCTMPFGCWIARQGGKRRLTATLLATDGSEARAEVDVAAGAAPEAVVDACLTQLAAAGGRQILGDLGLPLPAAWQTAPSP